MIDVAWSQFILVLAIALIFLGPKELPQALKTLGRWVGWARAHLDQFQSHAHSLIEEEHTPKTVANESDPIPDHLLENCSNFKVLGEFPHVHGQNGGFHMNRDQNLTVIIGGHRRHPWIKNKEIYKND